MVTKTKRVVKSEIPDVDEAKTPSEAVTNWIVKNSKLIAITIFLVILAFFSSFFYSKNMVSADKEAFTYFNKGLIDYQKLTFESTEDEIKKVVKIFSDVKSRFPGKKAAKFSELYLAHINFNNEKYDDAIKLYSNIVNISSSDTLVFELATEGIAVSKLSQKKYKEASEDFKKIINSKRGILKKDLYLKLASAYKGLNDKDSQVEVYEKILQEFPDDFDNEDIKKKITDLK